MPWPGRVQERTIDGAKYLVLDRWPLSASVRRRLTRASHVHVDGLGQPHLQWLPEAAPDIKALIVTDVAVKDPGELAQLSRLEELTLFVGEPSADYMATPLPHLRRLDMRYWERLQPLLGSPQLQRLMLEKASGTALTKVSNWNNLISLDLRSPRPLDLSTLRPSGVLRRFALASARLKTPVLLRPFPSLQVLELDRVSGWDPQELVVANELRRLVVEESGEVPEQLLLGLDSIEELIMVGREYALSKEFQNALKSRGVRLHLPPGES